MGREWIRFRFQNISKNANQMQIEQDSIIEMRKVLCNLSAEKGIGRERIVISMMKIVCLAAILIPPILVLFWNRFPLVFWDSSEYLLRWVNMRPGADRPIYYSLWLGAFHGVPYGLFLAALSQNIFGIYLLYRMIRCIPGYSTWIFVTAAAVIQLSPAVLFSVTLMPDFGVVWLALSLTLVLVAAKTLDRILGGVAAVFAILIHFGNLPVFFLAMAVLGLSLIRRWDLLKRMVFPFVLICIISLIGICFNSQRAGLGFRLSSPRVLFLANRLQQAGVLTQALKDAFAERKHPDTLSSGLKEVIEKLDRHKKGTGWFLWSQDSPLNIYWPEWRWKPEVYWQALHFWKPVVRAAFPAYIVPFIKSAVSNIRTMLSGRRFLKSFVPHPKGSGVDRVLEKHWGDSRDRQLNSRQTLGAKPPALFTIWKKGWKATLVYQPLLAIGILLLAGKAIWRRGANLMFSKYYIASALLATVYIANMAVVALFSSGVSRYQERCMQLPLIALLVFLVVYYNERHHKSRVLEK